MIAPPSDRASRLPPPDVVDFCMIGLFGSTGK